MFISDLKYCFEDIVSKLQGDEPIFISRIGGSDTDAVVDYLRVKDCSEAEICAHAAKHMPLVSKSNGFYDRTGSQERYVNYCKELIGAYQSSATLFLCNDQLLSLYFKDMLNAAFYRDTFENKAHYQRLMQELSARIPALKCYPYDFIEKMVFDEHTLFRAFSEALPGKTVLVMSPFSESIAANFHHRRGFFKKNYVYPDFDLKLVNTPITYSGLPSNLYPHTHWFSTLDALRRKTSAVSFDIALLACGSYAMPLGVHIERTLHRKAIYVGGVLQLYFGIMGRRYQNPFFLDQINQDNFISPLERERYLKFVTISDQTATEAFGAYF